MGGIVKIGQGLYGDVQIQYIQFLARLKILIQATKTFAFLIYSKTLISQSFDLVAMLKINRK